MEYQSVDKEEATTRPTTPRASAAPTRRAHALRRPLPTSGEVRSPSVGVDVRVVGMCNPQVICSHWSRTHLAPVPYAKINKPL